MSKKNFFFFIIPFFSLVGYAQHNIEVKIERVPSSDGNINVALYNTDSSFLNTESAFYSMSVDATEGTTTLVMSDIPEGTYAIALYHDEDANNELKTNWLGIPKEKVAFSNAKMKTFGPPKYKECSFEVAKDVQLKISL